MEKRFYYVFKVTLFIFMLFMCTYSKGATYYFSTSMGNDSFSSLQAQNQNTPWKSIEKLNSIFDSLHPGDNILFKSGDVFHGTLTITKSGAVGNPITFGKFDGGENPILTGFIEVNNWVSIGGNLFEAQIPQITSSLNTVLVDNVLQAMGRYPNDNAKNSGYLTIDSYSNGTIGSSDLQSATSFSGGEIVVRKNNWVIDRHPINWHSGSQVNFSNQGNKYDPIVGYGFFFQNHPGTLDKHGEWYFDKVSKKLLIYYQGIPSGANIRVATVSQVIELQNSASNILFNNLTLQGSNENLINLNNSSNFVFENCLLEYAGKNAINSVMSRNMVVSNTKIENSLNGGILLGWDDKGVVVKNSTFNKIFMLAGMGQNGDMKSNGIYMSETTTDALVEFTRFRETGSNAIFFQGNNVTIRNNLIDTFCFVKDDGGGIYTFTGPANTTFTNRKINNNIIVNGIGAVDGTKPFGENNFPYVEGIYLDLFSNGIEIDGNTIANVKSKGIFLNNSRNVTITNNKIFNTGFSVYFNSDYLDNLTRNIIMKNNEFMNLSINQLHVFVRSKVNSLSGMGGLDNNIYSRPVNEINSINLQTPGKNGLIDLQSWKDSYGLDKNSKKSPVAFDKDKMDIDEFILFDYNYSNGAKSLPLSGTYVDLNGKVFSGSVSIPAYSSVMLLKTEATSKVGNLAPTVSITSPVLNDFYFVGESIEIKADAEDPDGNIAKVEFYNENMLLGVATESPYVVSYSDLGEGVYTVWAKAFDEKGLFTESGQINFKVVKEELKSGEPKGRGLLEGLVSFYEMNTNLSEILRDSHGENHGKSNSINLVKGFIENGNKYEGKSAISIVPHSNSLNLSNEFTLMADIFRQGDGQKGGSIIIGKTLSNQWSANQSYSMAITSDNKIRIRTNNPGLEDWVSQQTVPLEKWVRIIATYKSGEGYALYFDKTDSERSNVISGTILPSDSELTIGGASSQSEAANGRRFDGVLDNVGIWNRKLTDEEIANLINLKITYPDFEDYKEEFDPMFSMSLNTLPVGSGEVSSQSGQIKNQVGQKIILNASAANGFIFDHWNINGIWVNGGTIHEFDMPHEDLVVTAHFRKLKTSEVMIISPVQNSKFQAYSDIQIQIDSKNNDQKIGRVALVNGNSIIATLDENTLSFDWKNVPPGQYNIVAKAFNEFGLITESTPIYLTVETEELKPRTPLGRGLLEGLVSFYEMNTNVSGILRDSHGENHGKSNSINLVNGFIENGNKYDGTSSISSVPHGNSLNLSNEFTLMADIFRQGDGQKGGSVIIGKTLSNQWSANQVYSMAITSDNKIRIRTNNPRLQDWVSQQKVPLEKWVRIIATYKSGEGYALYFDKTDPEKSNEFTGTIMASDSELTIGGASSQFEAANGRRFEGILDNVGIWNRKISDEEITNLITQKITYPDFEGKQVFRVIMASKSNENQSPILNTTDNLTDVEVGENLVFFQGEEVGVVFEHWAVNGRKMGNQSIIEFRMPENDITVTKHFRSFVAPEIQIIPPSQNADMRQTGEMHIQLDIKRNDAIIEKVELFDDELLVGKLENDFSAFDWKNVPEGNHQLTAKITDEKGNFYFSSPISVWVFPNSSKDIPDIQLEYVIGPNPAIDYLNLLFSNLDGVYDFEFRIVSMDGIVQKTLSAKLDQSMATATIDVSDLRQGTYVLHLMINGKNYSAKKFIKRSNF